MNATRARGASSARTQERLLDAAERLFAEKGLKATTIRDIVAAAKANLAAVGYHFGSKEALTRAVLARRLRPLNQERLRMLDAVERRAAERTPRGAEYTLPLEGVLEAFIAPTIRLFEENNGFMKILGRLHFEPDPALREFFHDEFDELVKRYSDALCGALPRVSLEEIFWRMNFIVGALLQTWVSAEDFEKFSAGLCRLDDREAMVRRLIEFGAAGLRAAQKKVRQA